MWISPQMLLQVVSMQPTITVIGLFGTVVSLAQFHPLFLQLPFFESTTRQWINLKKQTLQPAAEKHTHARAKRKYLQRHQSP